MDSDRKKEWEKKSNIKVAVIGNINSKPKKETFLEVIQKLSKQKDSGREPGE